MCFASPPQPPPMPALPKVPEAPATPPPAPSVIGAESKLPTIRQVSGRGRARQAAAGTAQFRMPQVSVTPTSPTAGGSATGLNIPK